MAASASKLSRNGDIAEANKDFISNLPTLVTDCIFQHLTLSEQAKMSVLSKKWRHTWSCVKSLVFDEDLWEEQRDGCGELDWENCSCIISNILLCHNGPVHQFNLAIPNIGADCAGRVNVSPWLWFLSRNGVKYLNLENLNGSLLTMPSNIFSCVELEELKLDGFFMNLSPAGFECFEHLRKLELRSIVFEDDAAITLIENCPKLVTLFLIDCDWSRIEKEPVINAPRLEALSIMGEVQYLELRNVRNLSRLGLYLERRRGDKYLGLTLVVELLNLASSCALEFLQLGYSSYELLFIGGIMEFFPLELTHLKRLYLDDLELDDSCVDSFTYGLIQSCPSIEELGISIIGSKNLDVHVHYQYNFTYDNNYELKQLQKVELKGITGSDAELKLIEYLLHASIVLEKLFIVLGKIDDGLEVELLRELNRFQRASPVAQIIFLQKPKMWSY